MGNVEHTLLAKYDVLGNNFYRLKLFTNLCSSEPVYSAYIVERVPYTIIHWSVY